MSENVGTARDAGEGPIPFDLGELQEKATLLAASIHQNAADRDVRSRQAAEVVKVIGQRFDAYEAALAVQRKARDVAEDAVASMEETMAALRLAHEAEVAELRRRHQEEVSSVEEGSREEVARIRQGVERLREEMGRRVVRLEEEAEGLQQENGRLVEQAQALSRSLQMLSSAVEAGVRSMRDEDHSLATVVESVNRRPTASVFDPQDLPPGVVRMTARLLPSPERSEQAQAS